MTASRDSFPTERHARRSAIVAQLALAGACLFMAARAIAGDAEIDDLLARQGLTRSDLLLDSEAILEQAYSDEADLVVGRLRSQPPSKSLLASEDFASLSPAARDRALHAIATARAGKEDVDVASGGAPSPVQEEREALDAIIRMEPAALIAVPGCRAPIRVPLFDFQGAARARVVELNDNAGRQLLAAARSKRDMATIALDAVGYSPEFRLKAARAAMSARATQDEVRGVVKDFRTNALNNPGAAAAATFMLARLEMTSEALDLIRSAEQPARDACLATLREFLASARVSADPWGNQMAFEVAKIATEMPKAAGAIYAALPREFVMGQELKLVDALGSEQIGAEAARALANTRNDEIAERLEKAGANALASKRADRLTTAKNVVLALRLMRTPRGDQALEYLSKADIADGPHADKLARLQAKAMSGV